MTDAIPWGNPKVLNWSKPRKVMSRAEWEAISADGAPPGVYVPNMSEADQKRWKAKLITGSNRRVEIRKTVMPPDDARNPTGAAQVLIVVERTTVTMSMNGKATFSRREWSDLHAAVGEAQAAL